MTTQVSLFGVKELRLRFTRADRDPSCCWWAMTAVDRDGNVHDVTFFPDHPAGIPVIAEVDGVKELLCPGDSQEAAT